jgi:hypothetical protein
MLRPIAGRAAMRDGLLDGGRLRRLRCDSGKRAGGDEGKGGGDGE